MRHKKGFRRLVSYLVLSSFQIKQLQAIKKELLGEKKHLRPSRDELLALVDAFEGEDFSSTLDSFRARKLAILRDRVTHAGSRTDTVLSVLTPEQRDLLADSDSRRPEPGASWHARTLTLVKPANRSPSCAPGPRLDRSQRHGDGRIIEAIAA